jgi:drug/metabolite transporter (DMT)-like permease
MRQKISEKSSKTVSVLLVLLQTLLYGVGTPITKTAYESISPLWCLTFRFFLATAVLSVFAGKAAVRELRRVRPGTWLPAATTMAMSYITFNAALAFSQATTVGFLMSLSVVFTPVLSALVCRRPYRKAMLPVQALAVGGLYLLCRNGGSFSFEWGEMLAVLCSLCVAGSLVWGRESLAELSALTVSLSQLATATVLSAVGALLFEPKLSVASITPGAWLVILYLAIPCGCLAYWLQNAALSHLSPSIVSLTQCAEPVFTAAASFLILNERLSTAGWCGAGLLFLCIIYGNSIDIKTNTV